MNETTKLNQVKILVIEDNNDHWILIEQIIHQCFNGTLAVRVSSAEKAVSLLEEYFLEEWEMPRLILLDLYLPTFDDGLRTLQHIKALSPCKAVPIVALSSSDEQLDITQAYEYGISSYCLKPINIQEWVALFESLQNYWLETATLPPKYYSVF